jgi:hypothetical protein
MTFTSLHPAVPLPEKVFALSNAVSQPNTQRVSGIVTTTKNNQQTVCFGKSTTLHPAKQQT